MELPDTVTKEYMQENAVFADALNHPIYGGRQIVDPDFLLELDTTELTSPFGDTDVYGKQTVETVQKYRDILKSAVIMQGLKAAYILLRIEDQTNTRTEYPVRCASVRRVGRRHCGKVPQRRARDSKAEQVRVLFGLLQER